MGLDDEHVLVRHLRRSGGVIPGGSDRRRTLPGMRRACPATADCSDGLCGLGNIDWRSEVRAARPRSAFRTRVALGQNCVVFDPPALFGRRAAERLHVSGFGTSGISMHFSEVLPTGTHGTTARESPGSRREGPPAKLLVKTCSFGKWPNSGEACHKPSLDPPQQPPPVPPQTLHPPRSPLPLPHPTHPSGHQSVEQARDPRPASSTACSRPSGTALWPPSACRRRRTWSPSSQACGRTPCGATTRTTACRRSSMAGGSTPSARSTSSLRRRSVAPQGPPQQPTCRTLAPLGAGLERGAAGVALEPGALLEYLACKTSGGRATIAPERLMSNVPKLIVPRDLPYRPP